MSFRTLFVAYFSLLFIIPLCLEYLWLLNEKCDGKFLPKAHIYDKYKHITILRRDNRNSFGKKFKLVFLLSIVYFGRLSWLNIPAWMYLWICECVCMWNTYKPANIVVLAVNTAIGLFWYGIQYFWALNLLGKVKNLWIKLACANKTHTHTQIKWIKYRNDTPC